jgi:hypothetical protein
MKVSCPCTPNILLVGLFGSVPLTTCPFCGRPYLKESALEEFLRGPMPERPRNCAVDEVAFKNAQLVALCEAERARANTLKNDNDFLHSVISEYQKAEVAVELLIPNVKELLEAVDVILGGLIAEEHLQSVPADKLSKLLDMAGRLAAVRVSLRGVK